MIDKYRLDDLRLESGEKGELARWVIQLQRDLDYERRKVSAPTALAAMDAEPVYQWRERHGEEALWDDCTKEQYDGFAKHPECEARILYAAPPAPVVPDECPAEIRELMASHSDDLFNDEDAQEIWNACRAAMLNHSEHERDMVEPVSRPYKLPENSFTDAGLEMMSHGDNPQANAYRELLAFRRNSPVIPEGWVMLPAEPTQAMMNAWLSEVANWRGHAAGYRAMIAAAPQQVGKY